MLRGGQHSGGKLLTLESLAVVGNPVDLKNQSTSTYTIRTWTLQEVCFRFTRFHTQYFSGFQETSQENEVSPGIFLQ